MQINMYLIIFHAKQSNNDSNTQTLFDKGDDGISIFRKQLLGKTPSLISLIAAFIRGKQTVTASLKSFS